MLPGSGAKLRYTVVVARERLHRKLLFSYLVVIGVFALAALALVPWSVEELRALAAAAALAAGLAGLFTVSAARGVGGTLAALARSLGELAEGKPTQAPKPVDDSDDEVNELARALGDLERRFVGERQALRTEVEKLRTVLDGMSEGVALAQAGRIVFANPAFTRLLDLRGPVEGHTPLEAVRKAALAEAIQKAGLGARPEPRDLQAPGGRVLQLRVEPLAGGAVVAVLLDVTEARSLERMRREFVANASHELRTPVAAIQAVAETLTSAPTIAASDRERFERILLRHAERLGRLVQDLLDLSRAEAERPKAEVVALRQPLDQALAAVRERAEARRITLDDRVPATAPILADVTSVEQVLVNLLDNAVKYTPEGGRVTVRAKEVGGPQGRAVRVEVEDTGVGIAAEHLPRLFERFYRVDPSRSRELGGTGLGLAIVKHLAQAHGGSVSVTSTPGVGSTFAVSFRAAPASAPASTPIGATGP